MSMPSRKALRRGCGYDASWARRPVTSKLTAMVFSRRFSSRDNKTLMKGPEASWEMAFTCSYQNSFDMISSVI